MFSDHHTSLLRDLASAMETEPAGEVALRWWTEGERRYVEVTRIESWKPVLPDRAARRAAEVQQVLDLIKDLGYRAVTLDVVRRELGFAKTTAYHRLTEARELADQAGRSDH